ncbi:histone-lysine N-methyltransferase SETDB2 isoform X6 [Balaenoptera musculus]|uniref:Histone-lysine N-methyltransferase SETDB2 isoform X6 n=1 Tax=Balaenoptera musculus TaxID=9771 RepID=A0A8B8VRX5_BALMU|nr:histone-lysine N-methyltransferase SETDB2 isoform X6 [Balaenoptera musculus]
MGEKNGDAKTFWMELEDDGKVDFIFEQVQNVLQSLKQKIKDGSATNKEYIQAMILVKEATINNNSALIKDHMSVTQNAQENKSSSLPSTSHEDSFPEDYTSLTKCACLQLTARNAKTCPLSSSKITTGYKYKRLQRQIPTGIYECSLLCKCNRRMCQNRVVQHGPQVRLQVFKTEKKGWGVRCLDDIDRGTFVCIYSGRLLSRSNTEKPDAIDENGKEENIMKNMFSKKRKIEVTDCEVEVIPLELETYPRSAVTEECPPKLHNNPKEPIIEMKCNSISRIQYHSVIRSPKTKMASIQHNGKKMGFTSSESVTSEDNGGFKPTQVHLNSKAKEMREDSSSNQVEDSEDNPVIESDVIDITTCREETPPGGRCHQTVTLDDQNEIQIQKPQEEKPPACQNQQVFCDKELPSETKNASSDSLKKFNEGNVFLLDATKEGNVGRFLNHSCCPNLLVQNVFVETHDRNFPLVAFFTNRYVKARTELTWDYGYEAGTMPEKEIFCQCGANKCRKKIL